MGCVAAADAGGRRCNVRGASRTHQAGPAAPLGSVGAEETDARALFKTLADIGGPGLVGPARELDPGLYYHPSSGGE